jgi:hypothetical protein
MDNGSSRFAKFSMRKAAKLLFEQKSQDKDEAIVPIESTSQQSTEADVDYRAEFMGNVLRKYGTNASAAAIKIVREKMRLLYSSEQNTLSCFLIYFEQHVTKFNFAEKFKYMLDTPYDPVIQWMKDSLIPFGKQLLSWCDGENAQEQSLHSCNGNFLHSSNFQLII